MEKLNTWKSLTKDYTIKQILDAFLGGFVFSTLLYVPIAIVLIELVTVYMYLLTFLTVLIIISLFVYIYLLHYFWRKSLLLKNKEAKTDITNLFFKNFIVINSIILIGGLVFIFVLIPILWV